MLFPFSILLLIAPKFAHNIALQIFKENLIPYLEPEPPASIEHREADLATFFNVAGKRKLKECHVQTGFRHNDKLTIPES